MLIVSDASPVVCLAICGKLDLLDRLFDRVRISQAVYDETRVQMVLIIKTLCAAWDAKANKKRKKPLGKRR